MATTNTPTMKTAIEAILEAHNLLEIFRTSNTFYVKFAKPAHDPLVIERHGNEVVVGHYFVQNGDVMADPEIVFDYETWSPVEITQHPVGLYRSKFIYRGEQRLVDTRFDAAVSPLVKLWAGNLVHQKWTQAEIKSQSVG